MFKIKCILTLLLAAAGLVLPSAKGLDAQSLFDFDDAGQIEAEFQKVGSEKVDWNARAGVGQGPGIIAGGASHTAYACLRPIHLLPGQSVVVSMRFQYTGQTARIKARNAGIYLTANAGENPLAAAQAGAIAIFFYNVGMPNGGDSTELHFDTGGAAAMTTPGKTISHKGWWDSAALAGHWCELKTVFTELPTKGMWEASVEVNDFGSDGDAPPVLILSSHLPDIDSNLLYQAESLYAGFQNLRNDRGFRAMDSFEISKK